MKIDENGNRECTIRERPTYAQAKAGERCHCGAQALVKILWLDTDGDVTVDLFCPEDLEVFARAMKGVADLARKYLESQN